MENNKILFVCPYPFDEAPSQRFRFEQYLSILEQEGYKYQLSPFLNAKAWKILYKSGNTVQKLLWFLFSFIKRFLLLFQLYPYEYIFIHREATPIGPPCFEWIVRFIWRKKIIYDFDDAIWLEDPSEKGSLKAIMKWKSKVKSICRWSHKVSCGNEYLAQFAQKYCKQVVINPTTIDTNYHKEIKIQKSAKPVIGWTGTHSTVPYLKNILPLLDEMAKEYNFELLIISNQNPGYNVKYLTYLPWRKNSEIEDLNRIDIGIMPLTDDIWSQGKCGFKLLQYMAIKKPVIASPVGVNKKLINESQAGLDANTAEEWKKSIAVLLEDSQLRIDLGNRGREYILEKYAVSSNKSMFLSLFA
jgi:glycosyltransferase involved in cell wall biosynthesis